MGESVCTKLIWIVCATWCASITWIACITCMGMHALHKLSGLHEQRAICVLDWSLFFFILVFNFTFIWLCSFLSKQKKAKNWHFFLVQKNYSQTASISLAMTVNTHQLDLSKAETFMGTILFGRLGKDCELPDATFASEDDQQSLAHKVVLTSNTQKWCFRWVFLIHHSPNITPIL